MLGAFVIVFAHAGNIGPAFAAIFKGAFGLRAVGGGIVGSGVKMALTWGMKRGVFSNEAGLGSSVMVHSSSNVREPVRQGMWGIFEVFADTIVVCTLTAMAVLTSGLVDLETGAVLSDAVKTALVGEAFSTVFGSKSTVIYKVVFVAFIVIGATMDLTLAWDLSDTFNGLMAIPNLIGVVALSPIVMQITKNYVDRRIRGEKVEPMLSAFPEIQKEMAGHVTEDVA